MDDQYRDRMAKRKKGRPPKNQPKAPLEEAVPAIVPGVVYPMTCPHCHRGMQPTIIRTKANGVRDLRCKQCGREFEFTPATVRKK